jgi:hypothetical protein
VNTEPLKNIQSAIADILSDDPSRIRQWLPLSLVRAIAVVQLLEDGTPRTVRQICDSLDLTHGITVQLLNAIAKGYPPLTRAGSKPKYWSIKK